MGESERSSWFLRFAAVESEFGVTEELGHIIEEPFGQGLNENPDSPAPEQLEVLPLGRYCADIASDAATLFSSTPFGVQLADMPGGDDDVRLFDEMS